MGVLLKVAEWVGNGQEQMLFLVLNWCQWNTHTKFPRSTSATRAISLLSPIILPLQTFFSRVLLRRQQVFSPGNFARQRPKTRTTTIKGQVFVFRYERVNSKRKFTIVAEMVFLLKTIFSTLKTKLIRSSQDIAMIQGSPRYRKINLSVKKGYRPIIANY